MKNKNVVDKVKKALLQLNITEKAIVVYVALLEMGPSSVLDVSRHSGVNRVSVYEAIDELKQKGFVSESRKGKRKLFLAEDPETAVNVLREKKVQLEQQEKELQNVIVPLLKAVNVDEESKPQIKFFEGADGVNKVFDEYILKAREAINCGSYDTAIKISSFKYELEYFEEIRKRKMFFRFILEDTPLNRKLGEAGKGIAHFKFLPPEIKISADIVVFGETTALISYEKEIATLIENKSIADAIRMYLDFMWERL